MPSKVPDTRLGRLGRIVSLSGKVGGNLLVRTANRLAGKDDGGAQRRMAKQLVATLGQMKGLAQKIGQAISMDIDHVPAEVREIISALQSKSEPMDYPAIARVVQDELGAPPEKLFKHFDRSPTAAASLGQVHRAELEDGRQVAVKVQYPGAAKALQADIQNIDTLITAVSGVLGSAGAAFKGHGYFDEVATQLNLETDYLREAENAKEFRRLVADFPEVVVPAVVNERCATRVLTLEWLEGESLAEVLKQAPAIPNEQRFRLSQGLIAGLFGPLLSHGLIHADPHPGNFLALADGRLGILDFGAVKRWGEPLTLAARTAYRGLLDGVPPDLEALLRQGGFEVTGAIAEVQPIMTEFFQLLRRPLRADTFDFGVAGFAAEFEALGRKNFRSLVKVRPPAEALMFFRAFGGHSQNLRALAAVGNFRAIYEGVYARSVEVIPGAA